ncbi:hypothetical protein TI04_00080 [Achromatium sp. WMS2]|nr:hypothetical protein TI04_00080 [Achromatium sp. WMS2]
MITMNANLILRIIRKPSINLIFWLLILMTGSAWSAPPVTNAIEGTAAEDMVESETTTPDATADKTPEPPPDPTAILPAECKKLATVKLRADKPPAAAAAAATTGTETNTPPAPTKGAVVRMYELMNSTPLWLKNSTVTPQATALLKYLAQADTKALTPAAYVGVDWINLLQTSTPGPQRVCRDLALSTTVMRYISDMRVGQVDPRTLGFVLDFSAKQLDLATFVLQLSNSQNIAADLDALEPKSRPYRHILDQISPKQTPTDPKPPTPFTLTRRVVRPGEPYDQAAQLAEYLKTLGDLPKDFDTGTLNNTYTDALVTGVKKLQQRRGLSVDGVIGPNTMANINNPQAKNARQKATGKTLQRLLIALERWRWMPDDLGDQAIMINIPAFRLYALERDDSGWYRTALEMNVIVGKTGSRYRTPLVHSRLKTIEFTPYWNVPTSILRREMYKIIKSNPGYVASRNYEVVRSDGTRVPVNSGALAGLWNGTLRLRQKPGGRNVLGEAKFIFPNKFAVYLHGTQSKGLFARANRALSHGCIRLQNPARLATHLLNGQEGWDQSKVNSVIAKKTHQFTPLAKSVPIYLNYETTVLQPNGRLAYYPDIYGYDKPLGNALEQAAKNKPVVDVEVQPVADNAPAQ